MRTRGRNLFPVGLYASLLAALLASLRPSVVAPLERGAQAVVALPFRAFGGLLAQPSHAGTAARARVWVHEFWRRVAAAERARRPSQVGAEFEPVYCAVTARASGTLVLDLKWSDVDGWAEFVTVGEMLVGFLGESRRPGDRVEVRLLDARGDDGMRGVPAVVETDAGRLRFVVEPAAAIDPWPLRCALLDDPYRAARIDRDGQTVFTSDFPADPLGALPPGLKLGSFRVWGYESNGRRLPIGFFVEPSTDAAPPLVTLWRRARPEPSREPRRFVPRRVPVQAFELAAERWFCALPFGERTPPAGAPLVRGDRVAGTVTSAGPGFAIVAPFGFGRAAHELLWMSADGVVRPMTVRETGANRDQVRLECRSADVALEARGSLFTSSARGAAGLWLGEATRGASPAELVIQRDAGAAAGGLAILVDPDGAP